METLSKKTKATAATPKVGPPLSRLGLGTAQFGMDYGIANKQGKTDIDEVRDILAASDENGMRVIDTAPAYGDSETVLGQALPRQHRFRIVTKTPVFGTDNIASTYGDRLRRSFRESLARLGQKRIYGLLVHNAENLLSPGGEQLMDAMIALKTAGKVEKIGVSVYTAGQIDAILARYQIDLIQLPVNLFDQRLVRDGHLSELKKRGIEIHTRSTFLQGLLLMAPEDVPEHLETARPYLARLRQDAERGGISPQEAALGFVKSIAEINCVLVGVDSRGQLLENIKAFAAGAQLPFEAYAVADEHIVNPSLWNTTNKN
ncbi:MAG: aldo/keto reductase [candidate division Zixibacteria bacterium]|nr:aldo/keto reductase [candidate division Zixibacteria bacterium]